MRLHLFFLMLVVATGVYADEPRLGSYTLESAVRKALQSNHELQAARLEVDRADARVREAWGYALPRIDLQATYSRALKKPVFFLPDFDDINSGRVVPIQIGSDHSVDVGFTATQTLFNSTVFIGVGAARIYSEAARETFRARQIETITNTRKAFYGVLVASEVADMMAETMKNAEENLRNTRILSTQGLVSEYDQLRAEVALANLQPDVIRARNGLQLAENSLKIAMGVPYSEEVDVQGSLTFEALPDSPMASAEERILDTNPTLAALRLQAEVNDAIVSAERSNYLPTLSAFGNYQLQAQKNNLRISTGDFIGSALVGVSLSMNIFSGLQTNARVEQARLEFRKSQEQIQALETNLRTLLESVRLQINRAQQQVEAQERTVELAEKGYRIATTRFTSGSGTQLEVQDAQLALTQARVNRIQAIYDYLVSSAELDQVLGILPSYVSEGIIVNEE